MGLSATGRIQFINAICDKTTLSTAEDWKIKRISSIVTIEDIENSEQQNKTKKKKKLYFP